MYWGLEYYVKLFHHFFLKMHNGLVDRMCKCYSLASIKMHIVLVSLAIGIMPIVTNLII